MASQLFSNAARIASTHPLSRHDRMLFEALLSGEHALHGFTNRDLRYKLAGTSVALATDPLKQSAPSFTASRR